MFRFLVGELKHILVGIQWKVLKICLMTSLKIDIQDWKYGNVNEKGDLILESFFLIISMRL